MDRFPRCKEGHYYQERIPVTSHVSDIPARLKEFDSRLFVMLNTVSQKYEVHIAGLPGSTLSCELPFDQLDARAIDYVRGSMNVDARKAYAEVVAHNQKLDQTRIDAAYDRAGYKTKQALEWSDHHSTPDIPKELIAE